jgi:hypothetical protein
MHVSSRASILDFTALMATFRVRHLCRKSHTKCANGLVTNALLIHPGIKSRSLESPEFSDLNRMNLSAMNKPLQCSRVDFQQCCGLVAIEQGLSARLGVRPLSRSFAQGSISSCIFAPFVSNATRSPFQQDLSMTVQKSNEFHGERYSNQE